MASVHNLSKRQPQTINGLDQVELTSAYTEHKITVRGDSGVRVRFKPYGVDDFDDWSDDLMGEIRQNQSALFSVGPSTAVQVETLVPDATVSVIVFSW